MRGLPQLPREVSPDGREIWDWAAKLSDAVHRADRARNLRADIAGIQRKCGSGTRWMHLPQRAQRQRSIAGPVDERTNLRPVHHEGQQRRVARKVAH